MISSNAEGFRPRVNFGWISESFYLFQRDGGIWVAGTILHVVVAITISLSLEYFYTAVRGSTPVVFSAEYWLYLMSSILVGLPVNAFFYGGFLRMANKAVRGQPLLFSDILSGGPLIGKLIVYLLIYTLLNWAGLIVLIVGALFSTVLLIPGFALLADGDSINRALTRSYNVVRQDWANAAGLLFVVGLLIGLSGLCIIGELVTIPMSFIIASLAYRDMIGMPAAPGEAVIVAPSGSWPPAPNREIPSESPEQGPPDNPIGN